MRFAGGPRRRSWPGRRWPGCCCSAACGDSLDARRPSHVVATVSDQIATVVIVHWTTDVATTGYVEYGSTRQLGIRTPVETTAASTTARLLGLTADDRVLSRRLGRGRQPRRAQRHREHPHRQPARRSAGPHPDRERLRRVRGGADPRRDHRRHHHRFEGRHRLVPHRRSPAGLLPRAPVGRRQEPALQRRQDLRRAVAGVGAGARVARRVAVDLDPDSLSGARLRRARRRHAGGDRLRGSAGHRRHPRARQQAGRGRARRNAADRLDQLELLRSVATPATIRRRAGRSRTRSITTPPRTSITSACAISAASPRSTARPARANGCWARTARRSRSRPAPRDSCTSTSSTCTATGSSSWTTTARPATSRACSSTSWTSRRSTATPVWSYIANPSVYTFVLGEPVRLADGGTFVNWSTAGQMERLDAGGRVDLEAEHGRGVRVRLSDPGRPAFTSGGARHEAKETAHEARAPGLLRCRVGRRARCCDVAGCLPETMRAERPGAAARPPARQARAAAAPAAEPADGGAGGSAAPAGTGGTPRARRRRHRRRRRRHRDAGGGATAGRGGRPARHGRRRSGRGGATGAAGHDGRGGARRGSGGDRRGGAGTGAAGAGAGDALRLRRHRHGRRRR